MHEKRIIRIDGAIGYVELTQGCVAMIDAEDAPLVAAFNWTVMHSKRTSYARRNEWSLEKQKTILLHRVVIKAAPGVRIDHRNGNGLDCRKENLRIATYQQNNQNIRPHIDNRTGLKGVHKHAQCGKYVAQIQAEGKRSYLGLFDTPEQAHAAYCAASAELHAEFGRTQ